jgi:hypothetical protein
VDLTTALLKIVKAQAMDGLHAVLLSSFDGV